MSKSSKRMLRVNELIKREIAIELEKPDFTDGKGLISVTEVDTAPDLRHAKIYISVYGIGDQEKSKVMRKLERIRRDLQSRLSKHVILKYTPVLNFILDTRYDEADKVLSIIEELENDEG